MKFFMAFIFITLAMSVSATKVKVSHDIYELENQENNIEDLDEQQRSKYFSQLELSDEDDLILNNKFSEEDFVQIHADLAEEI